MTRTDIMSRTAKAAATAKSVATKAKKEVKSAIRRRRMRRRIKKAGNVMAAAAGVAAVGYAAVRAARATRNRNASAIEPLEVELPSGFDRALEQVTAALQAEGFGVLTRINAHDVFQEKLGLAFRPYTILGACNPQLAFRALSAKSEAGLLLPCNVCLEGIADGGVMVRIADPEMMLRADDTLADDAGMQEVAREARTRLARVVAALEPAEEEEKGEEE